MDSFEYKENSDQSQVDDVKSEHILELVSLELLLLQNVYQSIS